VSFSVEKWRAILDAIEWFRGYCRTNDAATIRRLPSIAQDAARYRFLRDEHDPGPLEPRAHVIDQKQETPHCRFCHGPELDAACDDAISNPEKGES
jgi:hypothetical protein